MKGLKNQVRSMVGKYARRARRSMVGNWALGSEESWVDISDPYTEWVGYVNAGMLHRGSLHLIRHALSNLPSNAAILEIGCFCGLSLNYINYYRRRLGCANPLIGCDSWQFSGNRAGLDFAASTLSFSEYRELVMESFRRNVRAFSFQQLPLAVESDSNEFFAAWAANREITDVFGQAATLGGPLSFCHIDGDHSYDQAASDFKNCDRFLEPGGFILFDDSADNSEFEGVRRLMRDVRRHPGYEFIAKNPHYMFRKRAQ